jgi:transcriptional regulator with GAF, ATPase, and Fis domain
MPDPRPVHDRTAAADTLESRAERLTRLEAIDRLFPIEATDSDSLLQRVAEILREAVTCDAVSIEPAGDESGLSHHGAEPETGPPGVLRVPARGGGQTLAMIALTPRAPDGFTFNDRAVIARAAEHAAAAILAERLAEARRRSAALEQRTVQLDALLATLASARDVRDVFDRVSEIGKTVLPHDAMTIVVSSGTHGKVRVYAATGAMSHLPLQAEVQLPNQPLLDSPADHAVVTDLTRDEHYHSIPAVRAGMRSMLMMLNRVGGRVHSAVNFLSAMPGRFTPDDVPIGRRIADHIGLAVSQQRVADEARRAEILQNRTANLELLEELLKTLSDTGELAEVIDRVSALARKVLPHQATIVAIYLPDGSHARRYVSSGFDASAIPEVVEVPASMRASDWDYQLVGDLSVDATDGMRAMVALGFRSALRLAVRLDGRVVGALVFIRSEVNGFKHDDVAVGRRIADRVALCLARERGVEATRRADEASERAARLEARVRALTDELDARTGFRRVIGESVPWRKVLTQTTQVAATDTTVLLLGESGTGKEVVARLLHRGSQRREGPFVALNCAALPEQLLEAELFGYERGAFTGATQSKPGQLEQASGGVLFLDEVGEMSLSAQAKFLRVLQEREFQRLGGTRVLRTDTRIVAATNRDLQKATMSGQFREDLFYRLNVFAIRLPPLRERRDDILPLTQAFLSEFGRAFANPPAGISREAKRSLLDHHWPGNVRELRNILERAAILCDGGLITDEHLALPLVAGASRPSPAPPSAAALPPPAQTDVAETDAAGAPGQDLQSVERAMIESALRQARFNKSKAAKQLGLTRHQLYIRMRRHGLGN